jgi:hypothetical protein
MRVTRRLLSTTLAFLLIAGGVGPLVSSALAGTPRAEGRQDNRDDRQDDRGDKRDDRQDDRGDRRDDRGPG